MRYLSLGWIRALTDEVQQDAKLRELADTHTIGVTQVVTDSPEGDITYHLQVGDGAASFGAGPADPEDVKLQQSWETSVGVALGELSANEAFLSGKILLFGEQVKLMENTAVFGALDAVFSTVREYTDYS